jgi:hypothetical protein
MSMFQLIWNNGKAYIVRFYFVTLFRKELENSRTFASFGKPMHEAMSFLSESHTRYRSCQLICASIVLVEMIRILIQGAESRDSSVDMATVYMLHGRGSVLHSVQTGSGAHSFSCLRGTRRRFPRGKATETWSSPIICIKCRGQE